MISRRQLLYFSTLFFFYSPLATLKSFAVADGDKYEKRYPLTIDLLKKAYRTEMIASKHYDGYCQKALSEDYQNIAYLFSTLSVSEKIHADNYQKLIVSLGTTLRKIEISVSISNTKENLNTASMKELEKINKFYPEILKELSSESHEQAVKSCMYSWKSHQQHEEMINDIKKYSGVFFRLLARKIEDMKPNYYVCEICGSTITEKPEKPCVICSYPMSHYRAIKRPILLTP
ncbi:rubrerythrin [Desulfosarcina alkanivorans]|uniref:Rubrerythrin n=1 Tax=Desulfosarcina alkanivorans TaxID=571177 RepID=A0A5K7YSD1_9BACT|nr:ferritin family protein [Desulfosarcina alkanivorans]BBO72236.1 rubrerythrin [Desulfosarcina alkanivorans]